jgi:hypothetical protein
MLKPIAEAPQDTPVLVAHSELGWQVASLDAHGWTIAGCMPLEAEDLAGYQDLPDLPVPA